ncbi:MAG: ATP-dependent Clp protease adaptor ClpS [Cytophagaceae bacterium]
MEAIYNTFPFREEEVEVLEAIKSSDTKELIVFNDDINTFDHVINTLIEICSHTPEQAEQCTLIIHYKGKCTVKMGDFENLVPMRQGICDRGISAEIF